MDTLTILLIEDDKVDRKTYIKYLTEDVNEFKVNIFEAENAIEGLKLWKENTIDCILLDYDLPGPNGLEVLQTIKQIDERSVPIIILTGRGNEQIAVAAMKEGAVDYLVKSQITSHILVITIMNAINQMKLIKNTQQINEPEKQKLVFEEQSLLKNEFLTNMSHELKTPLNPIIGFTQLVLNETLGSLNDKQKKALNRVLTSAQHLLQIINNTITIADFTIGKVEFSPQECSVPKLINEVVANLKEHATEKHIEINCDLDKSIDQVFLDPHRFKEIIYNYLSNAIKFNSEGGKITIRIKPEAAENFRLEVEDNGIGINSDDLDKLFVPFQQLDSSRLKEQQGVGLGLALIKHIVEAMGGKVGVSSTFGKGSIFYAILPRKQRAHLSKKHDTLTEPA